ncbi:MAG: extracellular solute-binding protein [Lachnospiraceae bacterium]|nr:extracellular solute-binding protein [Lachnospiraceae bacterium]
MKRRKWFCLFLSVVLLLTGCGGKGSEETGKNTESNGQGGNHAGNIASEGRYDFEITEETPVFSLQSGESILGAQYLEGERIWFLKNGAGQLLCYHEDKGERELLLEHVPAAFTGRNLYMDGENFYAYQIDKLTVLDADGNEVNTLYPEGRIISLCASREGSIVLAMESGGGAVLKTLDVEGGTLSGACTIPYCVGIGTGTEREILVVDWTGAYDIDMESGEKSWHMKWNGTSYSPRGGRFWLAAGMGKDGILEQIESGDGIYYVVGLKKIDPEEMGKIPLVFRVLSADVGLKQLVAEFNRENKEYHVFLEDRGEEYGWDFQARNNMEIATGKGPDLIAADAVSDMQVLAEKGALENLEPYLAQAGMNREDYHPETFQSQGMAEGIYSAGYAMRVRSMYIRESFLDGNGQTGIEVLLDNMESYDRQAVFNKMINYTPVYLLEYFFGMSDNFYGMVDWEGKTCDFSGELWEQILRVCGQYGLTERNMGWEEIAGFGYVYGFSSMVYNEREAEKQGMVLAGYPAEEGMVNGLWLDSVAINTDSGNKEGAWQFIRFLLEEENQKLLTQGSSMPVHVGALEGSVEEYLYDYYNNTMTSDGSYIIRPELPEGIEEKFWECLANTKPTSYRTEQVLAIIEEEAEFYFTGDKTIEEISAVIENRVKLYLAELE